MRKRTLFCFLVLVACALCSCGPAPEATVAPVQAVEPTPTLVMEPAPAADLPKLLASLHSLGHASFLLYGPPAIYFDPTSLGDGPPAADIILISHEHQDHYAPAILQQIAGPQTVIVTSHTVAERLEKEQGIEGEVRALQPGEQTVVGEIQIQTVPAYNVSKPHHPKEAGNLGFIVTWGDESLYFAGDTDLIPEMVDIQCDVALLPIGGTYTMDVEEAAQAAAEIDLKVAVPMHERSADPKVFRDLCDCEVVILEQGR